VLNQKRAHLRGLEERFAITITISADATLTAPQAFVIDRGELVHTVEAAKALAAQYEPTAAPLEEEDDLEEAGTAETEEGEAIAADTPAEHGEGEPRRRRRRRRRGRNGGEAPAHAQPLLREGIADSAGEPAGPAVDASSGAASADEELGEEVGDVDAAERNEPPRQGEPRRRRRGRRGGRRNRLEREGEIMPAADERGAQAPQPALTTAEELTAPPATEPELKEAVADLDAAPMAAPPAPPPALEPANVPPPQAVAPSAEEPPRRRSTVREPAPISGNQEASQPAPTQPSPPASQPVITELGESEEANRPRRSGWWSRRGAGG
jgi:ribonuclease E